MRGFEKDTSIPGEIAAIREALARAAAAVLVSYEAEQAFRDANALGRMAKQVERDTSNLRGLTAARLADAGLSLTQIAKLGGFERSRAHQLVQAGRSKENTVTDPGTQPEPLSLALAIIGAEGKILVARRHDRIPPWTFPGTEIDHDESPAAAAVRAVRKETGLNATVNHVIGRRIHPTTGLVVIYLDTAVDSTSAQVGDPDLAEVRWIDLAEADQLMPTMFPTVRQHLARTLS